MPFYVYKFKPRSGGLRYPHNWEFVAKKHSETEAVKLAHSLCPRNREIYTEPGNKLNAAFFGSHGGRGWSAMIDTKDIHKC